VSHIDTVPACDGQTDRQTDRQTDGFTIASTALCIASYADALLKLNTMIYHVQSVMATWQ